MILANVAAAETLEKARVPLIYRVHDEPAMEKVNALREFLATLDIPFAKGGVLRAEAFNRILARVKGRDAEQLINEVVLRTQAQAEYAAENYGHFGLNLRRYAHFTSPIRRYADLIVHRGLIRALKLGDDGLPEAADNKALAEIAAQISATERRAMLAERETNDRLIAHFLADRVGATFDGRVSGVHRAGLFVKLHETGADGFVPARTIGDEYFRHDEAGHAMVGARSGETYRLGDRVTVKLVEAAPVAGALRFELLSEGRPGRPSRRPQHEQRQRTGRAASNGRHDDARPDDQRFGKSLGRAHDQAGTRPVVPRQRAARRRDADADRPLRARSRRCCSAAATPVTNSCRASSCSRAGASSRSTASCRRRANCIPTRRKSCSSACKAPGDAFARGIALAAVREMAEETGLLLGVKRDEPPAVPGEIWADFAKARVHPDLAQIHFIARAITPPRRPKRFDTRFFTADATAIAHKIEGVVGPDSELVELAWVPIEEATHLDMPTITGVVLEELAARVAAGMGHDLPVPFYFMIERQFFRELL